ncbi:MAG: acetylornithine/succinylornithine family transaminase [Planctomycetota bacterium]
MTRTASVDRTMHTYRRAAPLFVRGEGVWLFDDAGERYLDLISGIGANSLGHAHPRLVQAIAGQLNALGHVSNLYRHPWGEELSDRLCELTCMDAVFFCNSGSEANEAALKLARKFHFERGDAHRQRFVALENGFHGRTFGSLSTTANPAYREPFGAALDVQWIPAHGIDALEAALRDEPAALILEPIQGEGGVRPLDPAFVAAARELCTATRTVLIADEVQSGGGRTGTFLAGAHFGLAPDVVTLAKPLGAGLPIGAALARGPFAKTLVPGDHGTTFGGGPYACRAALAVLDELASGLQQHVVEIGAYLEQRLDALVERFDALTERRGRGLMQGVVAPGLASTIVERLFEARVLTCTAGGDVVRFLPPYVLTNDELDEGLERLTTVLTELQVASR